ncbi:MAG TPA: type I-E CRISPR-associated protein Cse1/CasA [Chthonomonadaceae bacterium]|nr:type I-E CRISPR-associated protein Cse1/CasA [Chthonomonadaceae bacterium]
MTQQTTYSFNLAERPCVPVLDAAGSPTMVSLRDAVADAHLFREVHHRSPVVTAALVRLLVALVTDIHPIRRTSDWPAVWHPGAFDAAAVDAYFTAFGDRFDLFHPRYPFYQCAALEDASPINLNLLACELSSGNNPLLFDHTLDGRERDYSPAEAFHVLVATQSFGLAGLLRRTTTLDGNPLYWQNAYAGPMVPGAMIWLAGDNLFETLALNLAPLAPTDGETDADLDEAADDRPIWRIDRPETLRDRQDGKVITRVSPRGTRDRLTFQARLVRLLPGGSADDPVVRRAAFNHGRSLDAPGQGRFDPMLAYRASKKEGYLVTRLSPERAAWRDFHALIGLNQPAAGRPDRVTPRALHQLHASLAMDVAGLEANRAIRLNVAGIANDQAKVLLWRHDHLDAPAFALCDENLAARLGVLLSEAEEIAATLRAGTRRLCDLFIAPASVDARGARVEGALPADTDRVTALADAVDTRPTYWARLESAFQALLLAIAADPEGASEQWKDTIEREARAAFEEVIERLGECPETWKAAELVRPDFRAPSRRPSQTIGKAAKRGKGPQ